MIKRIVRFLAAPLFIVMFITGWLIVRFFEYVFDDNGGPRMSHEILKEAGGVLPWLIFKDTGVDK